MTADPALGKYLPDAGKAVAYQSPSLANNWRGHPDLPGLGGMFSPSNLALYGYGHRQPVTLVDPDGFAPKAPKILASLFGRAGQDAYNLARVTTRLRNAKLAGTVHPKTKVPFDLAGNPDFSKFLYKGVDDAGRAIRSDVNIGSLTGSRKLDEALANAEAGLKETPKGYRWHHHQDKGRMQLVEETVHEKTGHTGGFAFHQKALATIAATAASIREASAQDWFNFVGETVGDIFTPLWLSPTEMGNANLYGPGTPFPTPEAYRDFQIRLQQAREAR